MSCRNAGDDARHLKRPAPDANTYKDKGPYCTTCLRKLTAPDREKEAARAAALKAKLAAACKDCKAEGLPLTRDVVEGSSPPLCASHQRSRRLRNSLKGRERATEANFGLTPATRAAILAAQGGACPICQRAKEATAFRKGGRRLAVDHDHKCCSGPTSCGRCVRGLLCANCNDVLAHFRDDWRAFIRGAAYLKNPPAHAVLLAEDDIAS